MCRCVSQTRQADSEINRQPKHEDLILASASPRRRDLMHRLGRPFDVIAPHVEDEAPAEGEPAQVACRLAEEKALDVARRVAQGTIIAADTLVAAGGCIVGKPSDADHARRILRTLSGTRHRVITGVCVLHVRTGRKRIRHDETWCTMRRMSNAEIEAYVASGEPIGKAGAYAIQEHGDRYVTRVEGSFSNVVGLPLELLKEMLREIEGTDAATHGCPAL